jgi:hypothetical protein
VAATVDPVTTRTDAACECATRGRHQGSARSDNG